MSLKGFYMKTQTGNQKYLTHGSVLYWKVTSSCITPGQHGVVCQQNTRSTGLFYSQQGKRNLFKPCQTLIQVQSDLLGVTGMNFDKSKCLLALVASSKTQVLRENESYLKYGNMEILSPAVFLIVQYTMLLTYPSTDNESWGLNAVLMQMYFKF